MRVADDIDAALRAAGRPERAEHEARYLKSELTHYGVAVPEIRRCVRAALRAAPGADAPALACALWDAEPAVHERRAAAVEVLDARRRDLGPEAFGLVERLLREARTWALVDPLATNVAGHLAVAYPQRSGPVLDAWAADEDLWLRRAALLALLRPLREGGGDFERFGRYADAMLEEREFLIRKAIGWILRDTARKRPQLVHDWLAPRVARASGLTVREAVRHLPGELAQDIRNARQR